MNETKKGQPLTLSTIQVEGFKSLRDRTSVELGALTILAGANSSGKSSLIQPVLLLKQTYDQPYDPGPLWLGGPNVIFSDVEQLFWSTPEQQKAAFTVAIASVSWGVEITFAANGGAAEAHPISIVQCVWDDVRINIKHIRCTPDIAFSSRADGSEVACF